MSSWNYRVVGFRDENTGEDFFAVHEVYYDDAGEPDRHTTEPVPVCGEDRDAILWMIEKMREAVDKPWLMQEGDKLVPYVPTTV